MTKETPRIEWRWLSVFKRIVGKIGSKRSKVYKGYYGK